jgi:hypothetical protein
VLAYRLNAPIFNIMKEKSLSRTDLIAELSRSTHGNYLDYVPVFHQASKDDPEFVGHLIAWNDIKGQVRDSKIAVPVANLSALTGNDDEFEENSFAHLARLDPRNLVKAWQFIKGLPQTRYSFFPHGRKFIRLLKIYIHEIESNKKHWDRMVIQYRGPIKTLYTVSHTKPPKWAQDILFDKSYRAGSVHAVVAKLKDMPAKAVASAIVGFHLPSLVVTTALGQRAKTDGELMFALIESMTPTELVTNSRMLQNMNLDIHLASSAAIRGAYDAKMAKLAQSKANVLKTTQAVEHITDEKVKTKLRAAQEKQIDSLAKFGGTAGIIGDKSGSMALSIDVTRQLAAALARFAGKVHLVFFNALPDYQDLSGLSYDEIVARTKGVRAGGGTSIGVGLNYLLEKGIEIDTLVIVSDGGENVAPWFVDVYKRYSERFSKQVPVTFYRVSGDGDVLSDKMQRYGIEVQRYDLTHGQIDYYSLVNTVQTMRVNRYGLIDEVMQTPLLTVRQVLPKSASLWA